MVFMIIYFLNFWLCWIFVALQWLSLVAVSEVYSPVVVLGILIVVSSLLKHRLYVQGPQWLKHGGSTVVAQGLRA